MASAGIVLSSELESSRCASLSASASLRRVLVLVVSMPSWEWFAQQDEDYRESVLPTGAPKLSVEAGVAMGWRKWVDACVSLERFGASAPGPEVLEKLGFTVDNVVSRAQALLRG